MDRTKLLKQLDRYKIPLLILALGLILMLLPTGTKGEGGTGSGNEPDLKRLLAVTEGVGRVEVLVSQTGAVVVCDGAENAKVRLDILRAVGSYTGLGSDKITVLKMSK